MKGRRVLVVEDEYFIADDLTASLRNAGSEVIGPVPTCGEAMRLIAAERIDLAVLDINLQGELIYQVADALDVKGVPFVFATGYDAAILPDRFHATPRWEKPFDPDALVAALPAVAP